MKNLLIGVVGVLMLAGPAVANTTLTITGPAVVATPGDPIQIVISVAADLAIDAWWCDLTATEPGAVWIEPYTAAAYSSGPVSGWGGGYQWPWSTAGQTLPVTLGDFNAPNTQASGQIFTAKLYANHVGVYTISLANVEVASSLGEMGTTNVVGYTVSVFPEPATLLLLAFGGMGVMRRRSG
jgi:hypothetical protein